MFPIHKEVMVRIGNGLFEARLVDVSYGFSGTADENVDVVTVEGEGGELGEAWVISEDLEDFPHPIAACIFAVLARTSQSKFTIHSLVAEEGYPRLPCFTSYAMALAELAKRAANRLE